MFIPPTSSFAVCSFFDPSRFRKRATSRQRAFDASGLMGEGHSAAASFARALPRCSYACQARLGNCGEVSCSSLSAIGRPPERARLLSPVPPSGDNDLQAVWHAPVAKVNDARAKRLRLDQLPVDPFVQGREVGRAAAE